MSSAPTLSIDARKWVEVIEASGAESLCSAISAKNVEHVLSTATVRGPQKELCSATSTLVPALLESVHGISILTSLVRFGTPATVEKVAGKLVAADPDLWSLASSPKKELVKSLSHLLERLVYREDCTAESYTGLLDKLRACKKQTLFSSTLALPAAARLMVLDSSFAASVAASTEAQKTFAKSCQDATLAAAAEEFCNTLFESPSDVATEFVSKSLAPSLKAGAKTHPREILLAALAARAPATFANKLAEALVQWPNLRDLCQRDLYVQIMAHILERADDEKVANKLVAALITEKSDVTDRMQSRKSAPQHLLAALMAKPSYAKTIEKNLGESQTKLLAAAKVRFANATQPKATSTQQAILEKLKKLSASGAGAKRAHD